MRMAKYFSFVFCVVLFCQLLTVGNGGSRHGNVKRSNVPSKTLGQVWPQPQNITQRSTYLTLDPQLFQFVYEGVGCPIIDAALSRYKTLIFSPPRFAGCTTIRPRMHQDNFKGPLPSLRVTLGGNCEGFPDVGMDEAYQLKVDWTDLPGAAQLTANSTWGIVRGLETFSQLVYHDDARHFYANSTTISDFPRFPFRGFLLDTSRHFVPVTIIKQHLDAMAYNKFNIFHWHITDDQAFPFQSQQFPSLSEKGAFNPATHIYTFNDVTSIINYARDRGIRVIPEFDTPGHTESWGFGKPGLLTTCYNESGVPDGTFGPINPILNTTYEFLYDFFAEAGRLFPDKYFHLGGDEVDFSCWASNPDINQFMQKMGFGTDYSKLESFYMDKLLDIVSSIPDSKNYIVWQEVFDNGCQINLDTVVNVWKEDHEVEMANVTAKGFNAILSSCWYLSDIHYGNDWVSFYQCEPLSFKGNQSQYDLVMGGSGCMWGEYVDSTNLIPRTWPRASAVAERLWSARSVKDWKLASPRLEEHRCRMLERNINAQPSNGPNFCPSDYLVSP